MGRCDDCLHWKTDLPGLWLAEGVWGNCLKASGSRMSERGPERSIASAYDQNLQHNRAELLTRYDFGCVQFEAKE